MRNRDVFESRYGDERDVAGEYTGFLSNAGEQIRLVAANGEPIADFTFGDSTAPGWPTTPDDGGPSLETTDLMGDYNDPTSWQASPFVGGTPGGDGMAPRITRADFQFYTTHQVALVFSEAIDLATLATDDFVMHNLTTGATLSTGDYGLANVTPTSANLVLSTSDGDWRLTLKPESISDLMGNTNDTEFEFAFFVLSGDYNRDRIVDAADFTVWRDTLGSTDDLRANGDQTSVSAGVIDSADYNVWRANLNSSLPAPAATTVVLVAEQSQRQRRSRRSLQMVDRAVDEVFGEFEAGSDFRTWETHTVGARPRSDDVAATRLAIR